MAETLRKKMQMNRDTLYNNLVKLSHLLKSVPDDAFTKEKKKTVLFYFRQIFNPQMTQDEYNEMVKEPSYYNGAIRNLKNIHQCVKNVKLIIKIYPYNIRERACEGAVAFSQTIVDKLQEQNQQE
jgi:hypothetical protein